MKNLAAIFVHMPIKSSNPVTKDEILSGPLVQKCDLNVVLWTASVRNVVVLSCIVSIVGTAR